MYYLLNYYLRFKVGRTTYTSEQQTAWVSAHNVSEATAKLQECTAGAVNIWYTHTACDGEPFPHPADLVIATAGKIVQDRR